MKNNISYYTHRTDSHRHSKFVLLRAEYGDNGWAMEARFWALMNIIADSDQCVLDLSKRRNLATVSNELDLSLEEMEKFVRTLLSEDIALIVETSPGCITAAKLQETFASVNRSRESARQRKTGKKQAVSGTPPENAGSSVEPEPKDPELFKRVKESKVKESSSSCEEFKTVRANNRQRNDHDDHSFEKITEEELQNGTLPERIRKLFLHYMNISPHNQVVSDVCALFELNPKRYTRKTVYNTVLKAFKDQPSHPPEKRNPRYLMVTVEKRLADLWDETRKKRENEKKLRQYDTPTAIAPGEQIVTLIREFDGKSVC